METPSETDYAAWLAAEGATAPSPADVKRYLRSATRLVNDLVMSSRYAWRPEEAPSSILQEAVFTQTLYWVENNIRPFAESVQTTGRIVASTSLLSGSMNFADAGAEKVSARNKAARSLCDEALLILRQGGVYFHVRVVG